MQARGRNATMLADRNPLPVDERLRFEEEGHAYFVDGQLFEGPSVTKLMKPVFKGEEFDAKMVITRNLASWRAKPNSKYHKVVADLTDDEATRVLTEIWNESNVLGTLLHKQIELFLNKNDVERDPHVELEYEAALRFFAAHPELEAVRTELSLMYDRDGVVVAVGQADLLVKEIGTNRCALIDFKRVNKTLDPNDHDYGRSGIGVMNGYKGNDFIKYSLQQALYAVMLEQQGIKVESMFLLKLHPSIEEAKLIQCADLRAEAREILDNL